MSLALLAPINTVLCLGKSTNKLFTLKQILEKTQEKQISTKHLFSEGVLHSIKIHKSEPNDVLEVGLKAAGGVLVKFQTLRGFRQGDALSCSFFNILLEMIMRAAEVDTKNMITNKSQQILSYADEIDVGSVASVFQRLEKEAGSRRLKVNADKNRNCI